MYFRYSGIQNNTSDFERILGNSKVFQGIQSKSSEFKKILLDKKNCRELQGILENFNEF